MNNIKSILLGIGMGVIISTLILAIYNQPKEQMTDQQIVEKAKSLGMVNQKEVLESTKKDDRETIIQKAKQFGMVFAEEQINNNKGENIIDNNKNDNENIDDSIIITIESGMTSKEVSNMFFNKGLIDKPDGLDVYLSDNKLTTKIDIGEYEIKKGTSLKNIAKIITR